MARVVSLECDKCKAVMRNDIDRIILWRRKIKFEKYDITVLHGEDNGVYLCGKCAKKFREWIKEG